LLLPLAFYGHQSLKSLQGPILSWGAPSLRPQYD
jgi:hypothetical protein